MPTFTFNMGGGQQQRPQMPKAEINYLYNSVILELYNNWEFVTDLMFKYKNNLLKQVNQVDHEWIQFIVQNNIQLENYETPELFLEQNEKK